MEPLYPTPLFFHVPQDVLHNALTDEFCELEHDMLCFEEVYQAVALHWPNWYHIIDLGGYMGVQGWLFERFREYICVDRHSLLHRCKLPANGRHVESSIQRYLGILGEFSIDTSNDLFVCSAVPDDEAREMALKMPNHVVWYPGEEMQASGPFARSTIEEFNDLKRRKWDEQADKLVKAWFGL